MTDKNQEVLRRARAFVVDWRREGADNQKLGTGDPVLNSYIDYVLGGLPFWELLSEEEKQNYTRAAQEYKNRKH